MGMNALLDNNAQRQPATAAANNGETVRQERATDKALAVICLSLDEHNVPE
jgi:hypothetical protein